MFGWKVLDWILRHKYVITISLIALGIVLSQLGIHLSVADPGDSDIPVPFDH
ncbi:MAG: hypothetical protein ACP6IS_02445 [Candidatus Asgardarchaeia archaeon]